jgi:hypothetical protein
MHARNVLVLLPAACCKRAFHFPSLKLPKLSLAIACLCGNEALSAAATAVQGSKRPCKYEQNRLSQHRQSVQKTYITTENER